MHHDGSPVAGPSRSSARTRPMNGEQRWGAGRPQARILTLSLLYLIIGSDHSGAQQPPPDATWQADAVVEVERAVTDVGLGAVQGVAVRDGKILAYGDVHDAAPRVGVIREY